VGEKVKAYVHRKNASNVWTEGKKNRSWLQSYISYFNNVNRVVAQYGRGDIGRQGKKKKGQREKTKSQGKYNELAKEEGNETMADRLEHGGTWSRCTSASRTYEWKGKK